MTKFEEQGFPGYFCLAALFWTLLTAASVAAAQAQEIVYTLSPNDAWPKSARADGKMPALSFAFGAQVVGTGPALPPPPAQDSVLTIPVGEPVALWLRAVMTRKFLSSMLVELPLATQRPDPRAPFAVRFTEVLVSSVQVVKSRGEVGPGVAEVKFKARRIEVFTATQDASGAMKPGYPFNWDFTKQGSF
jgi:hypothetical protein